MTDGRVTASLTVFFLGEISIYGEANISTKQPTSRQDSRVSSENGYKSRETGPEAAQGKGTATSDSFSLLNVWQSMSAYLRCSNEFQRVYRSGKRYEGSLMTAFVLPNNLSHDRLGVTASRKALGNAVQRNRAKRLLRETFRQLNPSAQGLVTTYDWVINAKRRLPFLKVSAAIVEFESLVSRVAKEESKRSG